MAAGDAVKGRSYGKTQSQQADPELLAELFASELNNPRVRFDILSGVALGRLVASITGLGGMVAFYGSSDDDSILFTVSFADKKRRYNVSADEFADDTINAITNTYAAAWGRRNPSPLSLLKSTESDETKP